VENGPLTSIGISSHTQGEYLATVTNRENLAMRKKSDYFEMIFSHSVPFSRTKGRD
jgi:hypothetical protein